MALVDEEMKLSIPTLGFPIYESVIDFIDGKAVPLPLREEVGFGFRIEDLEASISDLGRNY